jgi:hypothetical protein
VAYSLRLIEDTLAPGEGHARALPALPRVLCLVEGALELTVGDGSARLAAGAVWHGSGAPCGRAGADGAHLLRFELCAQPPAATGGGRAVLEHPIALDRAAPWLMRCDRVEFEPGGVALPHRHRGGGIRRLVSGRLEVTVGGGAPRVMRPGDAWFESGREPVLAAADPVTTTAFVRVAVLPAEIRGRSSILYVDPADASRSRPRTYTVYVDEPIMLT